jgi:carbon storage regulator CsrA
MLLLKRKDGEAVYIAGAIVKVLNLSPSVVTLGIDAPPEMKIARDELVRADMRSLRASIAEEETTRQLVTEGMGLA